MIVRERRGPESFGKLARERQAQFREQSSLPRYSGGRRHGHLLASGYEDENLYPTLRGEDAASRFFEIRQDQVVAGRKERRRFQKQTSDPQHGELADCMRELPPSVD